MEYIILSCIPLALVILMFLAFIRKVNKEDKKMWDKVFGELQDLQSEERWRDSPEARVSPFGRKY